MRLYRVLKKASIIILLSVLIIPLVYHGLIKLAITEYFTYVFPQQFGRVAQKVDAFRKAAVDGDADAQFKLAKLNLSTPSGLHGMILDADAGNRVAQACLGEAYHEGFGILPQDDVEADKWFAKAVEGANTLGETGLGRAYYYGWGVPKNDAEAVRLWKLAVIGNDPLAQAFLAYAYAEGLGGLQTDEEQSVILARTAAERGNATGQAMLGFLYLKGAKGLPQDVVQTYLWYTLAANQGNAAGIAMRDKLKKAMTQKELADADHLVGSWQQK